MLKESSNNNNKNIFSETTSIAKEKMICKDGFCSLPNKDEIPKQDSNDINLFDPVQEIYKILINKRLNRICTIFEFLIYA